MRDDHKNGNAGFKSGLQRVKLISILLLPSLLFLSMSLFPQAAIAATLNGVPTSDTAVSWPTIFPTSPTTHFDKVDDPVGTPDDATTYVTSTTSPQTDIYGFTAFNIPAGSTGITVNVYVRAMKSAAQAAAVAGALRVNGTNYNAATVNPANGTYTNYTFSWATNPNTAAAWTVADINGTGANPLQGLGIYTSDANPQVYVTQAYIEVVYTPPTTTTLATGSDPASMTVEPGTTGQYLDQFTLITDNGGGATVSGLTVTTVNGTAIASMQIWNDAMTTQYFATVNNPGSDTWNFSGGVSIPVTTASSAYRIVATMKDHATLASGTYNVTANVTSVTTNDPVSAGSDSAGATITVDNTAPANATWGTITPGSTQILLNWTNPGDTDFAEVVILRNTASITDFPAEGTIYTVPGTIGTSDIVYVGALQTFTDTGLTNGTNYYYKIFPRDSYKNYAGGAGTGPHVPTSGNYSISSCSRCHDSPPVDGTARNNPAGAVVGSHQIASHKNLYPANEACSACHAAPAPTAYGHRNGLINMNSVGINGVAGAYYDKDNSATHTAADDSFSQSNAPVFGSCRTTYCHGANSPAWGSTGTLTCASCHPGKTGVSPTLDAKHAKHYNSSTVAVNRNSTNDTTVANYIFNCGVCHNVDPTSEHVNGSNNGAIPSDGYTVDIRFNIAWATPTTGTYSSGIGTTAVGVDSGYTYWSNGTCSSVYCHSDGKGTYSNAAWDGGAATCSSCHSGSVASGSVTLSGKHALHMATDVYAYNCDECHSLTAQNNSSSLINDKRAHVNSIKNVVYSATAFSGDTVNQSGGTWDGSTCASIYCHSQGRTTASPFGGGPNNTVFTWTSAPGTLDCEGCHNYNAAATNKMNTNAHTAHMNNAAVIGTNFGCQECHNSTTTDGITITNRSNHANGARTVSILKGGTWTLPNCTSAYCHSTGQATPSYVNPPAWDSGTTLDCKGCHGVGSSFGEPNYLNGGAGAATANSHVKHVGVAADCNSCHTDTTTNGTAIKASSTLHTDSTRNINIAATYDTNGGTNSDNYTVATKTCASIYCHGTSGTPQWGATLACNACHGANNALPGKHAKHYGSATVATDRSAANSSSGTAYVYTCGVCHSATTHNGDVSANQTAEVAFDATIAVGGSYVAGTLQGNDNGFDWTNGTCSSTYCHSQGQSTTSPFGGVPNTTPTWAAASTLTCEGCHNFNAAATNKMSSGRHTSHINNSATLGTNIACQSCHNTTTTDSTTITNELNHVNKTKDVGMSSGTWTSPNCTSAYCHSTGQATPTYVNRPWNTAINLDCKGCHGSVSSTYGEPDYANGGGGTATANSHSKHVSAAADCSGCHTDTTTNGTAIKASSTLHTDSTRNVNFAASYDTNGGTNSDNYTVATKTCSAITCHGTSGTPQWGATLACNACHGANNALPGKHAKHYGSATVATDRTAANSSSGTAYVYTCGVCHSATTHNGDVSADQAAEVAFDATIAVGGTYTAGALVGNDNGFDWTNGTCSSTYCHSQGQSTTSPFGGAPNTTPTWNLASLTCEGCHNFNAAATNKMSSGRHTSHINNSATLGTNIACQECHNTTTSDSTTITNELNHVNKTKDVSIPSGGTWTSPDCTSAYCHSTGQATPTYVNRPWNTAINLDCKGCHGNVSSTYGEPDYANGGAGAATANSHSKHVSAAADCNGCHTDTTTTGTAIKASSTLHSDSTRNINIAASYDTNGGTNSDNYTVATKTCSAISCHASGTPQWGGASITCDGCHSDTADVDDYTYGNGTMAKINSTEWTGQGHGKASGTYTGSGNPAANLTSCTYCHDGTVAHGTGTNPFRLVNNGGADGQVGTCLICHKTGSAGYNPGAGLKNGTVKIDKYHQMTAHTQSGKNGGKFCWDCHDPHGDTTNQIQMTQAKPAKSTDGTYGVPVTADLPTNPIIFTDNASGTGAGGFAKTSGTFENGICNTCHTNSAATPKMIHYNRTASDSHNSGQVCTTCHKHSKDTTVNGDAFKGEGTCVGCHGVAQGARRIVTGASGDFVKSSRHVNDGTSTEIVINMDCVVCHPEGSTASTEAAVALSSVHQDGTVNLRNVDSVGNPGTLGTNYWNWPGSGSATATDHKNMDTFCLNCHDSTGASGINVNGTGATATLNLNNTRAMTPFNTNDTIKGSTEISGVARTQVVDVKGQFNAGTYTWPAGDGTMPSGFTGGNYDGKFSQHAVLGPRYGSNNASWTSAAWATKTLKSGQALTTVREMAQLHCSDCHLSDTNAHGSTSIYMLQAVGTSGDIDLVCYSCHNAATYRMSDATNEGASRFNHKGVDGSNISKAGNGEGYGAPAAGVNQNKCMLCHAGYDGTNNTTKLASYGRIHGVNITYTASVSQNSYRFFPGTYMKWYPDTWTTNTNGASARGCYFWTTTEKFATCGQHDGSSKTKINVNYGRGTAY